jgi:hypothetical protein
MKVSPTALALGVEPAVGYRGVSDTSIMRSIDKLYQFCSF